MREKKVVYLCLNSPTDFLIQRTPFFFAMDQPMLVGEGALLANNTSVKGRTTSDAILSQYFLFQEVHGVASFAGIVMRNILSERQQEQKKAMNS